MGQFARLTAAIGMAVFMAACVGPVDTPTPEPSAPSYHTDHRADGRAEPHHEFNVWGTNDDGRPIRWNPCAPIRFVVNPDGGPDGWTDDLVEAMRRVEAVTNLRFARVEILPERPRADRPMVSASAGEPTWAPVLVAWSSPGANDGLLGLADRGVAVPVAIGTAGSRTFVTGQIVLNADRIGRGTTFAGHGAMLPGFEDRAFSWGATILHELLHLLGLDHVDDSDQLMYGPPGDGPIVFGDGDLAGLRAVGGDDRCLDAPDVTDVTRN